MPQSALLTCTGFSLVELTKDDKKEVAKALKRDEGYLYVLMNDVVATMKIGNGKVITLKLARGFLVDGESNPAKKILPMNFSRWIDSNDTAEWLVHDYLYGAETDPKNPLAEKLTIQQKDSVFQDTYRRAGLSIGGFFSPKMDKSAVNDYAPESLLSKIEKDLAKRKKLVSGPRTSAGGSRGIVSSAASASKEKKKKVAAKKSVKAPAKKKKPTTKKIAAKRTAAAGAKKRKTPKTAATKKAKGSAKKSKKAVAKKPKK
jgi:hypothetical protein